LRPDDPGRGPSHITELKMTDRTETQDAVSEQEAKQQKPMIEMLPLPDTIPNPASGLQVLSVILVHDSNNEYNMHVAIWNRLGPVFGHAATWGTFLADVAYVIARDHTYLETGRDDGRDEGDIFYTICEGFKNYVEKHDADNKERKAIH
jgi:hypothetical protein